MCITPFSKTDLTDDLKKIVTIGHVDTFAQSLYFLTLFVLAVLLGRLRVLPQCCPFRVSWWAVSFPLAASAITALRFAEFDPNWFTVAVAWVLLLLGTLTIGALLVRTSSARSAGLHKGN